MSLPIVIIAAMAAELAPLVKQLQNASKSRLGRFVTWHGILAEHAVYLVQSGMGGRNAREAVTIILAQLQPAALYSIGFGGALRAGLAVGDLVLGSSIFFFDGTTAVPVPAFLPAPVTPEFLQRHRVAGSILTTNRIIAKRVATQYLPTELPYPVLDMETAIMATLAGQAGVPLLALRAISDPATEELNFSLAEFCDQEFELQYWRVLLTVGKKPWIIPQLLRLYRNSRLAAAALADGISDLLSNRS